MTITNKEKSQWEHDNQKHTKIEIIVNELEFMTRRETNAGPTSQTVNPDDLAEQDYDS